MILNVMPLHIDIIHSAVPITWFACGAPLTGPVPSHTDGTAAHLSVMKTHQGLAAKAVTVRQIAHRLASIWKGE